MALQELTTEEMKQVEGGNHDSNARDNAGSKTPVYIKRTGHGQETAEYARNGNLVVDNPEDF